MDEIDGAASEAAAGHAASEAARCGLGGIDEGIQFGATDGVIIAETGMRLGHPRPEDFQAPRGKGFCELENSIIFRYHMAAAAEDGFCQAGAEPLEVFQCDITEGTDSGQVRLKESDAFLALGAADIVFATGESVFHAGVTDHQAKGLGKGHVGVVEGSAVEEDGLSGVGMGGDELVHDAALGTGEMVFGPLAGAGELVEVGGVTGGGEEGEAETHFEGGGGAQSGAEGDFPGEKEIGALQSEAVGFQFDSDASEVIAPVVLERGSWIIEIHDGGFPQVVSVGMEEAIGARGEGGVDREMDGGGEDEAFVVIGMFADEVDTTWGAGEEGGGAVEDFLESLHDLRVCHGLSLAREGSVGNASGVNRRLPKHSLPLRLRGAVVGMGFHLPEPMGVATVSQ
jgi:hypothetical protein